MRATQTAAGKKSRQSGSTGSLESLLSQFVKGKAALPVVATLIFVGGCVFFLMELSADEEFEGSAWDSFWVPLIMSFFAGLSTTIGGLVIFLMGESPSDLAMALVLGLAAGVMIAVCIFDFWLPAARTAWLDSDPSELAVRALWTGVGVLLFLGLSRLLDAHGHSQEEVTQRAATFGSGERSTARHFQNEGENDLERDGVFHSSDSDTELGSLTVTSQQSADQQGGETPQSPTARSFSSSPSPNDIDRQEQREQRRAAFEAAEEREALAEKKWRLALLMMITLTAHNFPEGAAVAFSALESRRLGAVVMSAIAVHNIPEGLAIAVPVLASTGDRWKAIWMTLASGMSEPLGAAVGLLVLRPIMTEDILQNMLCAVAGVMAAVSLGELLPEARSYDHPLAVTTGFALGLLSIFLTYELV